MRIGILTGGGDCPGLNAVIRAVVRKGVGEHGDEIVGFRDGWRGVLEGDTVPMDLHAVRGILPRGGTVLGTSRTNPYGVDGGPETVMATLDRLGIEALIPIGGEDTLGVATRLAEAGVRVVGVPKTIDNDLDATDYTFGFDTAVGVAMTRSGPPSTPYGLVREVPSTVPPRGRIPRTARRSIGTVSFSRTPRQPSRKPTISSPCSPITLRTTARMTALRPGQSPPPVRMPMRMEFLREAVGVGRGWTAS